MLLCTVRDCDAALNREGRQWRCARGHSFDIARSGYVNLLQPQDRKSKQPGDTPQAVAGRRRLHDAGVTQPLLAAIEELAKPTAEDIALDAGCGEGFYLANIAEHSGCRGYGVDLSTAAIEAAAKRYKNPRVEWIAANADRGLPFSDGGFSLILSITGRMNAPEFRRVLHPYGRLLVAIPSPEDLKELRAPETGIGRDRVERTIETFSASFRLAEQHRATTHAELDSAAVEDLRHSIYRPLHNSAEQSDAPGRMRVTFSLDLLLLRPK